MKWELAGPEESDRVREFIQVKAGIATPKGPTQVLGFLNAEKEILGGFMFERYTGEGGSLHIHWAGRDRTWLARDMLRLVAIYMFDQLGCDRVFGEVRDTDHYTRRIDERIGFKEVALLPGYFPDGDLVIYSLTKQDCPWLPSEFKEDTDGQEEQATEGA